MVRLNLIESREKRVKRFIRLLTEATLSTGVVVDIDFGCCGDASMSARAADLDSDCGDLDGLHWNGKTKEWEQDA